MPTRKPRQAESAILGGMSSQNDTRNLAVFCDFENIALGARDARLEKFNITKILERLLLKGSIVVKKAYCDWQRYADFKRDMHEAAFEMIDIPHLRQSGKNSADIRMVVDALDLCYTKSHVDTFVIVSGDSDFSPLVSKLRENNKIVIGVGVKNATSDLLTANCDEFIFYDDLVQSEKKKRKRGGRKKKTEDPRQEVFDLVLETLDAVIAERDDADKIWGSMIKQTLKRRRPSFSESAYGFGSFSEVLEAMEQEKLLKLTRDERSGGFVVSHH